MNPLFTVAYPVLGDGERSFLDEIRARHDAAKHALIAPHFTLVFGIPGVSLPSYERHVEAVAKKSRAFAFRCTEATVGPSHPEGGFHVFFVPGEGSRELTALHERLHRGPFASHLRRDLPFVPHITVATLPAQSAAEDLCARLVARGIDVRGRIDTLTIGNVEGRTFLNRATYDLRGAARPQTGRLPRAP